MRFEGGKSGCAVRVQLEEESVESGHIRLGCGGWPGGGGMEQCFGEVPRERAERRLGCNLISACARMSRCEGRGSQQMAAQGF